MVYNTYKCVSRCESYISKHLVNQKGHHSRYQVLHDIMQINVLPKQDDM